MLLVEKEIGSVNEFDLVDGSIGIQWAKFRLGKKWARPVTEYYHEFKDVRGKKLAKCYDYVEIEYFNKWLEDTYMKEHLPGYLKNKFKKDELMYPRVLAFLPKLLPQKTA